MKIYGIGALTAPGTSRVVHDFTDGPFDTVNPVLIEEARRRGYSFTPTISEVLYQEPKDTPKDTPKKRGRKPKGIANVNATTDRTN